MCVFGPVLRRVAFDIAFPFRAYQLLKFSELRVLFNCFREKDIAIVISGTTYAVKLEAVCFPETVSTYRTTWCPNAEGHDMNLQRCEMSDLIFTDLVAYIKLCY